MNNRLTPKYVLVLFLSVFFIFSSSLANTKQAEKFYDNGNYAVALKKYKNAYSQTNNNSLIEKVADCYFQLSDYSGAEHWYWKAYKQNIISTDGLYNYASSLRANSKYHESGKMYDEYRNLVPSAKKMALSKQELHDYLYGDNYTVALANFNSKQDDSDPMIYQDNLYFLSSKTKKDVNSSNKSKLYVLNLNELAQNKDAQANAYTKFDSKYVKGGLAFHPFTGEIHYGSQSNGKGGFSTDLKAENSVKLFKSYINAVDYTGDFFKDQALEFNNAAYNIYECSFNNDGTEVYFSSDMPGGFGGADIWMSKMENGSFGDPVNLGPTVNTSSEERYPNLQETSLYFASSGLPGLGGLDLYEIKYENGSWGGPQNLKSPINSNFDDFSICFKDANSGFFTSNRVGGEGNSDIYQFDMKTAYTTILVYDRDTKEPLADFPVTLGNGDLALSDENGEIKVETKSEKAKNIDAKVEGFKQAATKYNENGYDVLIPMERTGAIKFVVQVLDKVSGLPVENATVELNDFEGVTDGAGYTYWLIYPEMEYTLSAKSNMQTEKAYVSLSETFSTVGTQAPDYWNATIVMEAK